MAGTTRRLGSAGAAAETRPKCTCGSGYEFASDARHDKPLIDEDLARAALERCVLFAHVDVAGLDACLACLRLRRFRRDETVFHQGDPGDALYVVASGPGEGGPAVAR